MKKQLLIISLISIGICQQTWGAPHLYLFHNKGMGPSIGPSGQPTKHIPFIFTNATSSTIAVHPYNNKTKGKVIGVVPPGSLAVQIAIPDGISTVATYQKLPNGQFKKIKEHQLKGSVVYDKNAHYHAQVPNALIAYNPSKNVSGKTIGKTDEVKFAEIQWFPQAGDPQHFMRLVDEHMPKALQIKKATK